MENSIEEDIKILENMNDGYTFKDCDICNNYNEKTKHCDKHKCMELQAIEHILSAYKKVLKQNEQLSTEVNSLKEENEELEEINNELEAEKNEAIRRYNFETIPIQKVKDKIEELKSNPLKIKQNDKYYYETHAYNKIIISVLQELIEVKEV